MKINSIPGTVVHEVYEHDLITVVSKLIPSCKDFNVKKDMELHHDTPLIIGVIRASDILR